MSFYKFLWRRRLLFGLLILLAGVLLLGALTASGSAGETRGEGRGGDSGAIWESYEIQFPSFTWINLTADYQFHRFVYGGHMVNASETRELFDNASQSERDDIRAHFQGQVESYLNVVINRTFDETTDQELVTSIDMSTLRDLNHTGPIVLRGFGSARLSNVNFDLDPEIDADGILHGVFRMGAIVELNIHLSAPEGNSRNFTVSPPSGINIRPESHGYTGHPTQAFWQFDNITGQQVARDEQFYLEDQNPNRETRERVGVEIFFDWQEFNSTEITVVLEVFSLELAKYSSLSDHISGLDYIPADGVRMALDNTLGSWNIEEIKQEAADEASYEVRGVLSDALGLVVPLDLSFRWDNASLSGYNVNTMSSTPPLRADMASDSVAPSLYAIQDMFEIDDLEVVMGFLNAGASAQFDIDRMNFDQEYDPEITLLLPQGLQFINTSASESQELGRYSYSWNPGDGFYGTIVSPTAPKYTKSKVELDGILDLEMFKVDLFDIESSSLSTDFSGQLRFYQFKVTEKVEALLPEGLVDIAYINADVLRLVHKKDLIDLDELLESILEELRPFEEKFSKGMGVEIYLDIDIDISDFDQFDIDDMDNYPPVKVKGATHVDIPFAEAGDLGVESAFILKRVNFDFAVPKRAGWLINMEVRLPKGIEVISALDKDKEKVVVGKTSDGRSSFVVQVSDETNHVYLELGITPMIIYDVCASYLYITIGLVILSVMWRRHSKKQKKIRKMIEAEDAARVPVASLKDQPAGRSRMDSGQPYQPPPGLSGGSPPLVPPGPGMGGSPPFGPQSPRKKF